MSAPRLTADTVIFEDLPALHTSAGQRVPVQQVSFLRVSYCLDIALELDAAVAAEDPALSGHALAYDPAFIGQVNAWLRSLGYAGRDLDRAESGMQEVDKVWLEGTRDLQVFAWKQGWWTSADGDEAFAMEAERVSTLGPKDPALGVQLPTGERVGLYRSTAMTAWAQALAPDHGGTLAAFKGIVLPATVKDPLAPLQWALSNASQEWLQAHVFQLRAPDPVDVPDRVAALRANPIRQF